MKSKQQVSEKESSNTNLVIDSLITKAIEAEKKLLQLNQSQIDKIVDAMCIAGASKNIELAKFAVEETGRGVFEDKVIKNLFATEYIHHDIKHVKTVGIINDDHTKDYFNVAEPVGIIAGVTPVTNPTSTAMFKAIISIKTRNPIIFAFHPSAQKCSAEAARIVRDAAIKAGAPEDCVQWIEEPSLEATNALMNHEGISLILATGGSGMVKSAYSCGKPALGVGPGNVPAYLEKSCNVRRAVSDIIISKTFDNGMICASEQAAIVDEEISKEFEEVMKELNCHFCSKDEIKKLEQMAFPPEKNSCALNPNIVGKSANWIAEQAGFTVPPKTKILVAKINSVGNESPLSREKLSPVLAYIVVKNSDEGIEKAAQMVEFGGLGHSAAVHSTNEEVIKKFSKRVKAGRIVVNTPSTQGAIGDLYNSNRASLTLGCGSYGKNSIISNVTCENLINLKRVARRKVNMQWFKIPEKIYFEWGSTCYLEKMPNISKVMIVTDPGMVNLGYTDIVINHLERRIDKVHFEIFSDVEPDPSVETVLSGVKAMERFKPDCIIALGGGSAIDAAKGMWLFYEHPNTNFDDIKLKFVDIRKRTYKFPKLGQKAKLVAIPTTSGTGSEVTAFSVITDKVKNVKYPLADYELTPDVAIIDTQYVMSLPKAVTADTGLDVLTHAIEAYVSILASDYTDALAMKAIQLVFEYLPRAFKNGSNDKVAREKMHNASAIAGMAFTNAFLGINHSLAHKLGGEFHIPHGRANAILLPHVIKFNSETPTKLPSFPKYEKFIAHEKYAEIARTLGLKASTTEEGVNSLIDAVKKLMSELEMPSKVSECGISKEEYMNKINELAVKAFDDQCTGANPRYPLVEELLEIYKAIY